MSSAPDSMDLAGWLRALQPGAEPRLPVASDVEEVLA
jgi:hypothetical protein